MLALQTNDLRSTWKLSEWEKEAGQKPFVVECKESANQLDLQSFFSPSMNNKLQNFGSFQIQRLSAQFETANIS